MKCVLKSVWPLSLLFLFDFLLAAATGAELSVVLRKRIESDTVPGLFRLVEQEEQWSPTTTAIIVCDVWNEHWCRGATERVNELVPRIEAFVKQGREQGMLIVHAPSDTMKHYTDHPARQRARSAPAAASLPKNIASWCTQIPAEEKGIYPLDQSDGGCDCQPHCKSRNAWTQQHPGITIRDEDAISDSGVEIWNLLESRGITHAMILGVHTNMCVLGRPFGLRQLTRHGKTAVLVRDLTDTMYNHEAWPYVNHFRGNELMVEHIEKFVAPTITSAAVLGDGKPFRFRDAPARHVVFMIGEEEYATNRTLPEFARVELEPWNVKCSFVMAEEKEPNTFSLPELISAADVLVLSVRRRTPPAGTLALVREHLVANKGLVGIRTASHAFSLRNNQPPPAGHAAWPEFDHEVLGGNYQGHYGVVNREGDNGVVSLAVENRKHPLLAGIPLADFRTGGSVYKNTPLPAGNTLLLTGKPASEDRTEPVAWTHQFGNSRIAYTSLGHPRDFEQPAFRRLLSNAIFWALEKDTIAPENASAK